MVQRATIVCTGWESPQATGITDTPVGSAIGTWSVTAAAALSGSYGLRLNPTAERSAIVIETATGASGNYEWIARFKVRYATFPNSNYGLFHVSPVSTPVITCGLEFNSATNCLRPLIRNEATNTDYTGTDGSVLSTNTIYRIDIRLTRPLGLADNTRFLEWYLDGVAQTSFTQDAGGLGSYTGGCRIGETPDRGNTTTADIHVDDLVLLDHSATATEPAFPIGPGAVVGLSPASDGTHVNGANFTDNAANSPPASVYDRVDETIGTDVTDYVYQDTTDAASYLVMNLADTPADWPAGAEAHGASVWMAYNGDANGAATSTVRLYDTVNSSSVQGHLFTSVTAALTHLHDTCMPHNSLSANWTKAAWDAFQVRWGESTDITPQIRLQQYLVEVAYPTTPATGDGWGWGDGNERWHYV